MRISRSAVIGLAVLGLLSLGTGCAQEASTPATTPVTVAPATTNPATTAPGTTAPTTAVPETTAPDTTAPTTEVPGTTTPATTTPATTPATIDVTLYFLRDERLAISHREVAGPAVLGEAITELLAGPTSDEQAAGLTSTIPAATRLLGVNLDEGLATIDLSHEFGDGGGSLSMTTRVAEIVFTATQFPNVDQVIFWIDGAPVEYLGGEGLTMDQPWSRSAVGRDISGSVLIDTPSPGDTVRSTFTVTGEADVFEAQFPIEVWRDGVMIGGLAPVTGGAWGVWAPFEATLTVDVAPGPIELMAYDPGGCGDDPECPAIVKTVVPLILGG